MTDKFVVPTLSTAFLAVTITPELISAVGGVLAIIISALFVGIVNTIAVRKAVAPVVAKVDKIEAHVNSDKTRDQGIITSQQMQIDLQRETIEELKKAASLLAQAKAATELATSISQAAVAGATTPTIVTKPG